MDRSLDDLARRFLFLAALAAAGGFRGESGMFIKRAENAIRYSRRVWRQRDEIRAAMN